MRNGILFVLAISFYMFSFSCGNKTEPKAEITVVDTLNKPIQNATVRITSKTYNASSIIDETQKTDVKGKAYFTFKLEAILEVIATSGPRSGQDFIQLKSGETVEKTVVVK